jgi:hypothetical protein
MAQKSKKQPRKIPAAARQSVDPVLESQTASAAPSSSGRSYTAEFNPDYSQTIKDLKRIGILAGSFFALLIILAFVLP